VAVDPIRGAGDLQTQAAGCRTAELFEQHGRMVYALCRALLRDPDDADDATQSTFISAYKALLGGSAVREPAAWLATIARNECGARAQARMREPLPLFETDAGHAASVDEELERKALVEELQHAIALLPDKQREAVVLRDLYGLPYSEVGVALGMSVAAVESLLFRARRSLRVSLRPLVGGALAVPVAVREGIAQALPSFATANVGSGGAVSGGIGLGLLAKLTGGPLAVKIAAGVVAVTAAGSMVAIGSEQAGTQRSSLQRSAPPSAAALRAPAPVAAPAIVAPAGSVSDHHESGAVGASSDDGGQAEASAVAKVRESGQGGEGHGSPNGSEVGHGDSGSGDGDTSSPGPGSGHGEDGSNSSGSTTSGQGAETPATGFEGIRVTAGSDSGDDTASAEAKVSSDDSSGSGSSGDSTSYDAGSASESGDGTSGGGSDGSPATP